MKNKYLLPICVILFICSVFAIVSLVNNNLGGVSFKSPVNYHSDVCVYTTGNFEGRKTPAFSGIFELVNCDSNVLFNTGKDLIEDYLGDSGGTGDEVDQIELCNATGSACETPTADGTAAFSPFIDGGLQKATGTYADLGTGNWSIQHTFTATADNLKTNVTRIGNTAGTLFAANEFTSVTLQTNDQLTINWTIWVD